MDITRPTFITVVVVGQGYVGLPAARAAWRAGHTVIGYDTDPARVASLLAGRSPIEDVTDAEIHDMLDSGRYTPTTCDSDLAAFNVALVTVPTPLRDGRPDLTFVLQAAHTLADFVTPECVVILESTVAPGTTSGVFREALETNPARLTSRNGGFAIGFSPERIDPGNPTWGFVNTPKLISATTPAGLAEVRKFYNTVCQTVVETSTPEIAEMAKLLENTYRHVNIALVNELSRHAHKLGIDIWEVVAAAATKPYGFQPFFPGPGVGGHCLPVDPVYLADEVETSLGRPFAFVDLAMQVNAGQPEYVAERVIRLLNDAGRAPSRSRVLVLGAAYKAGTGDVRETPASPVIDKLLEWGASVAVCDPRVDVDAYVTRWATGAAAVTRLADLPAHLPVADLVLLLTDHPDFPYDLIEREASLVLDTRNRLGNASKIHKL